MTVYRLPADPDRLIRVAAPASLPPQAWRPPALNPRVVAAEQDLFASAPLEIDALDVRWRLTAARPRAAAVAPGAVDFALTIGGETAILRAPWGLAERALRFVDPSADLETATPDIAAMLIEHALTPCFDRLEVALAAPLRLTGFDPPERRAGPRFDFTLTRIGSDRPHESWRLTLFAAPEPLAAIGALWARRPRIVGPLAQATPFAVSALAGAATVTVAEAQALEPGDTVLVAAAPPPHHALLSFGAAAALARLAQTAAGLTARLIEPVSAAAARRWPDLTEGDPTAMTAADTPPEPPAPPELQDPQPDAFAPAAAPPPENAALDALPVRLTFEIARAALPFAELQALDEGSVLLLGPGPAPRVDVLANGKRVATGDIVAVGDDVGVRITALTGA